MTTENYRLYEALRLQLAAIKQHFIHILILEAREDKESAASINRIDSIDLPCAMMIIERLVSTSRPLNIYSESDQYLQALPAPGFSNSEIIASEQLLEKSIVASFAQCIHAIQPVVSCAITGGPLCLRREFVSLE